MLCKDSEELVKNYRMGSITAENFLLLIQHTKECSKCQAIFEEAENSFGSAKVSTFSSRMSDFFEKFNHMIKAKQEDKKFYTRKAFYAILLLILSALTTITVMQLSSVAATYYIIGIFIVLSAITIIGMLFTTD
jgi:amino acid permease